MNTLIHRCLPAALLALAAIPSPAMAADPAAPPPPATAAAPPVAPATAPAALVQRILGHDASLLVLDVRTAEEYAASHISGARNLPHDQIEAQASALPADRNAEIVVYCRSGRRSAMAEATLQKLGYQRVIHLDGDFIGWQAAGRPVDAAAVAAAAPAAATPPAAPEPPKKP